MKNLNLSSVLVLSASSAAHAQEAVQWKVSDGGNGHWYQFEVALLDWPVAQQCAAGRGAHLVTITSQAEYQFIRAALGLESAYFWLGGLQQPNSCEPGCGWKWITDEPWDYVNWNPGEPSNSGGNENWAECYPSGGWNDRYPGLMPSLVEWSADCNNDGIVDYGQCRDGSLPDYNGNNVPDCCESGTTCVVGIYPVQWRVAEGGNGHWYQLVSEGHPSWTQAKSMAELRGGYLATLTSQSENDLAGLLSRGMPAMLLGGFQDRTSPNYSEPFGAWKWITGEPWSYSNWGAGEPNDSSNGHGDPGEDYLYSWTGAQGFKWGDGDNICPECNPGPLLIEWSADCNDDGMVDYGQILQGQLVDADANGVPDICEDPCPGDITNGGTVDATDLSIVLAAWGTNGQGEFQADIDGSGLVDGGDLALVLGGWGPCPN